MWPSQDNSTFDWASFVDYAVQLLTIAYAAIATAIDFKEEGPDRKKRLSKAGRVGVVCLIIISLSGIGVRIHQHRTDVIARGDAAEKQQKIIGNLQDMVSNSRQTAETLLQSDKHLKQQTSLITQQASILKQQNGSIRNVLDLGNKTLHQTDRILDPLDPAAQLSLRETIGPSLFDRLTLEAYTRALKLDRNDSGADRKTGLTLFPQRGTQLDSFLRQSISIEIYPEELAKRELKTGNRKAVELDECVKDAGCASRMGLQPRLLALWTVDFECRDPESYSKDNFPLGRSPLNSGVTYECSPGKEGFRRHSLRSYVDLSGALVLIEIAIEKGNLKAQLQAAPELLIGGNHTAYIKKLFQIPCRHREEEFACFVGQFQ